MTYDAKAEGEATEGSGGARWLSRPNSVFAVK